MDFGRILDQWERRGGGDPGGQPSERDGGDDRSAPSRYQRMRNREPEAEIDLHGLTVPEAQAALERFLRDAISRGLGKVLVIHGKGNHTQGRPVLESRVRAWLEGSPLAGAFGRADRRHGGSGATWVILRGRDPGAR